MLPILQWNLFVTFINLGILSWNSLVLKIQRISLAWIFFSLCHKWFAKTKGVENVLPDFRKKNFALLWKKKKTATYNCNLSIYKKFGKTLFLKHFQVTSHEFYRNRTFIHAVFSYLNKHAPSRKRISEQIILDLSPRN